MPRFDKGMTTPKDVDLQEYENKRFNSSYRQFTLRLDSQTDRDVIDLLSDVSNIQYIKELIRANQDKNIKCVTTSKTPSVSRCIMYSLILNSNKDQDIIDILARQSSVTNYILSLIRNDQSQVLCMETI